jgi:hypothetical protein
MLIVHTQQGSIQLLCDSKKIIWLNERPKHDEPVYEAFSQRQMRMAWGLPLIVAHEDPFNIQRSSIAILIEVPEWDKRKKSK